MPVNPGLTTVAPAGHTYYRTTSLGFNTPSPAGHPKVVNGQGAVISRSGARYNHAGACTVYLAEDLLTCLAEKMFYFHREVIRGIDISHSIGTIPPFMQRFVLWEIELKNDVTDVCELDVANASAVGVIPSLMTNPSQDYGHLKDRRAFLQHSGYKGLRAPSSRVTSPGNMVVLFNDQSGNLARIIPHEVEFRLVTAGMPHGPFVNHATQVLDFTAGEVRMNPPSSGARLPSALKAYSSWSRVEFNH
jgi:RES domain-containing protein